ncbi:unnamed protein product, partial [Rotaria socialis]
MNMRKVSLSLIHLTNRISFEKSAITTKKEKMDPYVSPYASVVPRILPNQYSSKKIPMIDEGHQYADNYPPSRYVSPTTIQSRSMNFPPLSTRAQIMNNEMNHQEIPMSNQSIVSNSIDNSLNGRTKNRMYHEPLKDNSGDIIPRNSYSAHGYPSNYDNGLYEIFRKNSNDDNKRDRACPTGLFIIIVIIIGLFSLTALTISIYLL